MQRRASIPDNLRKAQGLNLCLELCNDTPPAPSTETFRRKAFGRKSKEEKAQEKALEAAEKLANAPVPAKGEIYKMPFKLTAKPQIVGFGGATQDENPVQIAASLQHAVSRPFSSQLFPKPTKAGENDRTQCHAKIRGTVVNGVVTQIALGLGTSWKWGAPRTQVTAVTPGTTVPAARRPSTGNNVVDEKAGFYVQTNGSIASVTSVPASRRSSISSISSAGSVASGRQEVITFHVKLNDRLQDLKYGHKQTEQGNAYDSDDYSYNRRQPKQVLTGSYTCNIPFLITAKTASGTPVAIQRDVAGRVKLTATDHLLSYCEKLTAKLDECIISGGQIVDAPKAKTWTWDATSKGLVIRRAK